MGEKPGMPMESSRHEPKKPFKMPHMPHMPMKDMYKHMMPTMPHRHVKEPYMYQHLLELKGRRVEVATQCKTVKGKLKGVFPDHVLVEMDRREYHIRLKTICFVSPFMDP